MKHPLFRSLLCTLFLMLNRALCQGQTTRSVLPNGIHLVVAERHTVPLVAIDLWVRAGSAEERSQENGCAHFLEHTLFKGTTTRGVGAADEAIESLGGVLNAATGADYAHYYTEVPAPHVSEALAILADIVRNATFPDAEVDRERGVILAELARHQTGVADQILDGLYARVFAGQPYASSPGGMPAAIEIRARDTLVSFYHRNYTPDRCCLALAGDITPELARNAAVTILGDWHTPDAVEAAPVPQTPLATALPTVLPAPPGTPPTVGLAYPAPAASQFDLACLAEVTAALLGSQEDGGSFGTERWSGTEVTVRFTPRRGISLFSIIANLPAPIPPRPFQPPVSPAFADISSLETALIKQIDSLRETAPTQGALNAAKRVIIGHLLYATETDAGLAHEIGYADLVGGETPDQLRERLNKITPSDVQKFAATWLLPAHMLTLHALPGHPEGKP